MILHSLSYKKIWQFYKQSVKLLRFWATVCLCYQTVVCLSVPDFCPSVLSVTLVYCGQMVGWIKMKLSKQVGLGPCHIVRWGPSYPPTKGAQSPPPTIFHPCQLLLSSCLTFILNTPQEYSVYRHKNFSLKLALKIA